MSNVTLSLVVTPRQDMKLTRPISGFMQKYSSRQHQERFIEIEYIRQYVKHRITDQNIILSFTAFTPSFSTTQCFTMPRYQVSVYRTIGPLVMERCVNKQKDDNRCFYDEMHCSSGFSKIPSTE